MKGTIISLGNGFGYIKPASAGSKNSYETNAPAVSPLDLKELFFHVSALEGCEFKDLKIGDQVKFEVDEKSPAAGVLHVRKLAT